MKKQKVLQVLFSGLGGHGSVFFSLVEGDTERETQHAALFFGTENTKQEYLSFCQKHEVDYESVIKDQGIDFSAWLRVFKFMRKKKPDVVLLHSLNLLHVALVYSWLSGCRLIVVEHTPLETKTRAEWASTLLAMLLAPKIVLLTTKYARDLKLKIGKLLFRDKKICIINNGVNADKYKPTEEPFSRRDEKIISMIARFSVTKDQATLVRALGKLKEKFSAAIPIKLHLAGSGETLEEVKKLAIDLGLGKEITFAGMLDEEAVIPFLQSTDIYVHSSKSETMSTSVLQAMAVGLPVIGSDINGVNNLIKNKETGLLFTPGDDELLASQIEQLLTDERRAKELGLAAREYALQHYSHREMYRKYAEIFTCRK